MPRRTPRPSPEPKRAPGKQATGRVRTYSNSFLQTICDRIANGETYMAMERKGEAPDWATFYRRMNQSSDLRSAYAAAQQARTARWAEELTEISDDGTNDYVIRIGRNGKAYEALNDEHVRRSTLRVDTRKFLLSKLMPRVYGDRIEHTGAGGGPIEHHHTVSAAMTQTLGNLRRRLPRPEPIDVTPTKES